MVRVFDWLTPARQQELVSNALPKKSRFVLFVQLRVIRGSYGSMVAPRSTKYTKSHQGTRNDAGHVPVRPMGIVSALLFRNSLLLLLSILNS
jgi:hypothetical protein